MTCYWQVFIFILLISCFLYIFVDLLSLILVFILKVYCMCVFLECGFFYLSGFLMCGISSAFTCYYGFISVYFNFVGLFLISVKGEVCEILSSYLHALSV